MVVVAFSHEKAYFEPPMRYTKMALVIFGFGLVLGLVVCCGGDQSAGASG